MSQIEAVPCFDVAKSVAKVFYPGIDNETAEWLANTTGNNPLLIAHYKRNLSSQTYKAIISDKLHPWWCEIYESLIPGDHRLSNTRSLFLALYFQRPITEFNLNRDSVRNLLPVLCRIIYLDSTDTPQLYLKMLPHIIEESISSLSAKLGAKSDESSAIGFSYELSVLSFVSETALDTRTSESGSSVETFDLPKLAVSPKRFDPALTNNTSPVGLIQMTPKRTQAIDAFVKLSDDSIVLIQVSTRTSKHTEIVQSVCSTPTFIREMFEDDMSIYYLYINPNCVEPIDDLKCHFFNAIPRPTKGNWWFCMPSCPVKFLTEYERVKRIMSPV